MVNEAEPVLLDERRMRRDPDDERAAAALAGLILHALPDGAAGHLEHLPDAATLSALVARRVGTHWKGLVFELLAAGLTGAGTMPTDHGATDAGDEWHPERDGRGGGRGDPGGAGRHRLNPARPADRRVSRG